MPDADPFAALADPSRRRILALLASRPATVQDLACEFPFSRPAVSKHLRVLREAGLVREHKVGRRRFYRLVPGGLARARAWMDAVAGVPGAGLLPGAAAPLHVTPR